MASTPPSGTSTPGTSTPNSRFTSQRKTAEDLLSTQTVGLVALSDFRKRRAEALEQKEKERDGAASGTPRSASVATDGTSTPPEPVKKKKKRKIGTTKLSFDDEEEGGSGDAGEVSTPATGDGSNSGSSTPDITRKKAVNSNVAFVPKVLTKGALLRDAQARESLRKEFLSMQEAVRATEVDIPFVFYDGTNIPGGVCRIKKGEFVWVFLDRSRKVGAELGVGEGNLASTRKEWARVSVDDLMMVRGSVIIPHHYDFYYFAINRTLGPNNRLLFDYSAEPPKSVAPPVDAAPLNLDTYNPLSRPSKDKDPVETGPVEGTDDDPTYTKVVDRRWYERHKHIFPASVWQEFDPEKDYQKEVKRDAGGNAFFFS